MRRRSTFTILLHRDNRDRMLTMVAYDPRKVSVKDDGIVKVDGFGDIVARMYDVVGLGERFSLIHVVWPAERLHEATARDRLVHFLRVVADKVPKAAILAGRWPTGRAGAYGGSQLVARLARRLASRGVWPVPVAYGCSSYNGWQPELLDYFWVVGHSQLVGRDSWTLPAFPCSETMCCAPTNPEFGGECRRLVLNQPNCPMVLMLTRPRDGLRADPCRGLRYGERQ